MNIGIFDISLKYNYGVIPLSLNFEYMDLGKVWNCFERNHKRRTKSMLNIFYAGE